MILEDITGIDLRKSKNPVKDVCLHIQTLIVLAKMFACDEVKMKVIPLVCLENIVIEVKLND